MTAILDSTSAPTSPATTSGADFDAFDLDVRVVASHPVIPELMRNTDDGCGSSCQSACSNSGC